MNNENLSVQQVMQQNQVIDVLLKENAYLKGIINTYLLNDMSVSNAEKELIRLITGNISYDSSNAYVKEGNIPNETAGLHEQPGNSFINISNAYHKDGNIGAIISNTQPLSGNIVSGVSSLRLNNGNNAAIYDLVIANVQSIMKTAGKRAVQNTARLLLQLDRHPAKPTSELCKLTGMSKDGMAKRIMAMKKAGLIVRYSAPLRYVLTEKAKELLKEHSEYYRYSPGVAGKGKL